MTETKIKTKIERKCMNCGIPLTKKETHGLCKICKRFQM